MATLSQYALITLDEFKQALGGGWPQSSNKDSDIVDVINKKSDTIERFLDREIVTRGSRTVYFNVPRRTTELYFYEWPVTSVASVYESPSRTYDATSLLVENTGYVVVKPANRFAKIIRTYDASWPQTWWIQGWRTVQATYTAGYASTATVPEALKSIAMELSAREWRHRERGDGGAVSTEAGPFSASMFSPSVLTDKMRAELQVFKRPEMFFDYEERIA